MEKFQKAPTILPVKPPSPRPTKMKPPHPHLPNVEGHGGGSLLLMISPVRTGKSTLISNMLLREDFYDAQERFDQVNIISNTIANDVTSRYLLKRLMGIVMIFMTIQLSTVLLRVKRSTQRKSSQRLLLFLMIV